MRRRPDNVFQGQTIRKELAGAPPKWGPRGAGGYRSAVLPGMEDRGGVLVERSGLYLLYYDAQGRAVQADLLFGRKSRRSDSLSAPVTDDTLQMDALFVRENKKLRCLRIPFGCWSVCYDVVTGGHTLWSR